MISATLHWSLTPVGCPGPKILELWIVQCWCVSQSYVSLVPSFCDYPLALRILELVKLRDVHVSITRITDSGDMWGVLKTLVHSSLKQITPSLVQSFSIHMASNLMNTSVLHWTWSVILYSFLYNKVFGPGRADPFRAQICCVRYRQSGGGYMKNGDRSKIQMDVEEMSVFWRQHWPTWALWTEESTVAWMWLKKAFDYGCWRRQQGGWS